MALSSELMQHQFHFVGKFLPVFVFVRSDKGQDMAMYIDSSCMTDMCLLPFFSAITQQTSPRRFFWTAVRQAQQKN